MRVHVLTQNENGDPVEDGSHVSEQPHDHSQLWTTTPKCEEASFYFFFKKIKRIL